MTIRVKHLIGCVGLSAAMLMGACQTTGTTDAAKAAATTATGVAADAGSVNPLYSGLALSTPLGITRTAESSVCTQFYSNAAADAAAAAAAPSSGGGFGAGLLKTVGLGVLSGVAAGGVGALGIASSFVELAVSNAASQVVYQGGAAALEGATGGGKSAVSSKVLKAADALGCPAPTAASLIEASSDAGAHSHTHTH